jgi:hypothetical protein
MTDETRNDALFDAWRRQSSGSVPMATDEIRRRAEKMANNARRLRFDLYLVVIVMAVIGSFFGIVSGRQGNAMASIGWVLAIGACFFVNRGELRRGVRAVPAAELGSTACADFVKDELRHRIRNSTGAAPWIRMLVSMLGVVLIFIGNARANPKSATFMYVMLLTAFVAQLATIPVLHRAAAKFRREIEELDRLQEKPS